MQTKREELNNSGAGGGRGGQVKLNTGPKAKLPSEKKEKECLAKLGATDFKFGYDTSTHIKTATGLLNGKQVTIKTYFTRYNSVQLGYEKVAITSQRYQGPESGLTLVRSPLNNDVASDVVTNSNFSAIALEALYAHEVGNAIAFEKYKDDYTRATGEERDKMGNPLMSSSPPTAQGDRDPGVAFERCLYGGIVGLRSGRIGNSREF
jgi:hypothetical protein